MKKKKIWPFVLLGILIGIFLIGAGFVKYLDSNMDKVTSAMIKEVDLSRIEDGIYKGSYNAFPVIVDVEVTIHSHSITKIKLIKHMNGQGSAAENITDIVIEAQSLQVDVVSGATYSSKVILKAIEDALTKGK
jgi:uncharacterized protein with FMN-binding domain